MSFDPSILRPGDVLLYAPSSLFGRAIAWMTSGNISHVEIYKGDGRSYASRDGIGVAEYPFRVEQLCRVLRSRTPLNMGRMAQTFAQMRGHKYDWAGIWNTATGGRGDSATGAEVCSEAATIWLRTAGMFRLFGAEEPENITPRDFEKQPDFWQVWSA